MSTSVDVELLRHRVPEGAPFVLFGHRLVCVCVPRGGGGRLTPPPYHVCTRAAKIRGAARRQALERREFVSSDLGGGGGGVCLRDFAVSMWGLLSKWSGVRMWDTGHVADYPSGQVVVVFLS